MKDNILNTEINQVIQELKTYFSLDGLKQKFTYEDYKAKDAVELETSHEYLEEFSRFLSQGHQITIPSLMAMIKRNFITLMMMHSISILLFR